MATSDTRLLDITSTNSKLYIQVEGLYPTPTRIERFGTDSAFEIDEHTIAETRFGVDGGMAAGYVPNPVNVTVTLEAGSESATIMENILLTTKSTMKPYNVTMIAELPALGKQYVWSQGTMLTGTLMPNPKKTLEPTKWSFTFANVQVNQLEATS